MITCAIHAAKFFIQANSLFCIKAVFLDLPSLYSLPTMFLKMGTSPNPSQNLEFQLLSPFCQLWIVEGTEITEKK